MSAGALLIRADAGPEIGGGHWMRCLALAQSWRALGGEATFAAAEGISALEERLRAEGCEVRRLEVRPGGAEDAAETARLASNLGAQWIVADGYRFTGPFQEGVKGGGARLLVVDDYGSSDHYAADAILNPNTSASPSLYRQSAPGTKLLLGPRYALLREEFRALRRSRSAVAPAARRILVSFGASDPRDVTSVAVEALLRSEIPALEVVLVVGPGYRHGARLEALARPLGGACRVVTNPSNLPELMAWAELALSSASTMAWELLCLGVPLVTLVFAENHAEVATSLDSLGVAVNLGWCDRVAPDRFAAELAGLTGAPERRRGLVEAGLALVDGDGAERVCRLMTAEAKGRSPEIHVRPAGLGDAVELFALANEAGVRASSFTPGPISWETHAKWFRERLASDACRLWVLEAGGAVAAQVRYETSERAGAEAVEVALSVVPCFRGRGLAARLLRETWHRACSELGAARALAVVKEGNAASATAFERAGFRRAGGRVVQGAPCFVYERALSEAA